ncbi:hypothetical protein Goklo_004188, partial [Gossypium klotzschianum]|nr:hypothetical protein [Gossypium klotzschianum]
MALTSDGKLYGWGWNKKVVQVSCGWRHTLAITEEKNVFSWGRGTNGQLGHGESTDRLVVDQVVTISVLIIRNVPKIIEALSVDGSSGQQIESSKLDPLSAGKTWVSPTERYAIVPDESGQTVHSGKGNGGDVSVPENDVKRIRIKARGVCKVSVLLLVIITTIIM